MKAQLEQARTFNTALYFNKFEIQRYHQNEPKFNGVYSGKNLPKIKDGAYVINLGEFKSIGTHRRTLYVNNINNNNNNDNNNDHINNSNNNNNNSDNNDNM